MACHVKRGGGSGGVLRLLEDITKRKKKGTVETTQEIGVVSLLHLVKQ